MNNTKTITHVEHPRHMHMVGDGFRVSNYLPGYRGDMSDDIASPFIMLDYNAPWSIPSQTDGYRPGVGFHPHRGFETVTIVYSGEIEHQDTAWWGGVIAADEVQWMTAGSGLLHNEFMTERFARAGGVQHVVQLWVNLPREFKMVQPRYQALTRDNIPEVGIPGWRVRVIAGEYHDTIWPAMTYSPVSLYDIRFNQDGEFSYEFPEWYTTCLLVTEGNILIGDTIYHHGDMIHFSSITPGSIWFSTNSHTKILLMAGKPLGDPVVHYWPFVMNTEDEIKQAIQDYNAGKFENR